MSSSGTCYLLPMLILTHVNITMLKICLWLMLINMMLWPAFPVHQWAILFSLEFLDLLELYLPWQSKQKLAVFTSYGFADSEWTVHFSFSVWRQSKILAHIHEAGVNREGSILSPLARSSLVSLGTGTGTPNSPFCHASRVPNSGISLSWSCWKGTQTSLNIMDGFSSQPSLLPGHYMNPPQLFTAFQIFPIKVQIVFLLIYPSLFIYCSLSSC